MRCYIGIGSNLGDRRKNIKNAVKQLRGTDRVKIKSVSGLYETDPVGGPPQDKYLNGVIEIDTDMEPRELLSTLQGIENDLGRIRTVKDGPRTIDLDILTYGDKKMNEPDLKIPHPRMHEREFVMQPLRDIVQG